MKKVKVIKRKEVAVKQVAKSKNVKEEVVSNLYCCLPSWLVWIPRGLAILLLIFYSLFALEVFSFSYAGSGFAVALLTHTLPALLVLAALIVAWRKPSVGALIFVMLGLIYAIISWNVVELSAHLFVSFPLMAIGILFFFFRGE